jgi:hypothetical protein
MCRLEVSSPNRLQIGDLEPCEARRHQVEGHEVVVDARPGRLGAMAEGLGSVAIATRQGERLESPELPDAGLTVRAAPREE